MCSVNAKALAGGAIQDDQNGRWVAM